MHETHHARIHRELFLSAFGARAGSPEPWVIDRLASLLEEQFAHAGEALFHAGDSPDAFFLLRQGRVELARRGSAPWVLSGRSAFGMADALLDRPRARTAVALTDVEAMKVHADACLELLEDSFALARIAVLGSMHTVADLEELLWAGAPPGPRPAPAPAAPTPLEALERLALLAEVPLLRGAGVQNLSDLALVTTVVTVPDGGALFERDGVGGRAFVLVEGEVTARRDRPEVTWQGGAGEIVGGAAAFTERIAAWEAVARTRVRALTFRIHDWLDLLEAHFEMVRFTLGALSLRREDLHERLTRAG